MNKLILFELVELWNYPRYVFSSFLDSSLYTTLSIVISVLCLLSLLFGVLCSSLVVSLLGFAFLHFPISLQSQTTLDRLWKKSAALLSSPDSRPESPASVPGTTLNIYRWVAHDVSHHAMCRPSHKQNGKKTISGIKCGQFTVYYTLIFDTVSFLRSVFSSFLPREVTKGKLWWGNHKPGGGGLMPTECL